MTLPPLGAVELLFAETCSIRVVAPPPVAGVVVAVDVKLFALVLVVPAEESATLPKIAPALVTDPPPTPDTFTLSSTTAPARFWNAAVPPIVVFVAPLVVVLITVEAPPVPAVVTWLLAD